MLAVARTERMTLKFLKESNVSFKYCQEARYATYVIFLQFLRFVGTVFEVKTYFS